MTNKIGIPQISKEGGVGASESDIGGGREFLPKSMSQRTSLFTKLKFNLFLVSI